MAALTPLWVGVWDQALLLFTSLSDPGHGSCPLAWDRGVTVPVPAVGGSWHLFGSPVPWGQWQGVMPQQEGVGGPLLPRQ